MTAKNRALYEEAIYGALDALVLRATTRGRGWYHYDGDALVVVMDVLLDGGVSW